MRLARPALITSVLLASACGKEENISDRPLVDYVHAYPEAPRDLTINRTTPWDSGRALAVSDAYLFAADRDNRTLVRIDRKTLAADKTLVLGGTPEQLVLMADGNIFVTLREAGEIVRIAPDFTVAKRQKVGVEAFGIAVLAAGQSADRIYVTLPAESAVVVLDKDLDELARESTYQNPRGAVVTAQRTLVVTHQNADALTIPIDADGLLSADLETPLHLRRQNPNDLAFGTITPRAGGMNITAGRAVTLNPETGTPLIAHSLAFTGTVFSEFGGIMAARSPQPAYYVDTTTTTSGTSSGTIATPLPIEVTVSGMGEEIELPVMDPATGGPLHQMVDQPSDILHHPTKSLLFVTGYGTDNVLVLSTAEGDPMRSCVAVIDVGHAPTAIGFSPDGRTAYVLNSQQFSISKIDIGPLLDLRADPNASARRTSDDDFFFLSTIDQSVGDKTYHWDPTESSPRVRPQHLASKQTETFAIDPLTPAQRRGVRLFTFTHNDSISRGGSFACASCHIDGGDDKLVWVTSDGPRQTPALAGRLHDTAPFSWNGAREELQQNMQATVQRMGGTGMQPHDLDDLEAFILDGLTIPKNPFAKSALTEEQLAGKAIFESEEAQCATCHRPDQGLTDGLSHDVGTASELDVAREETDISAGLAEVYPAGLFNTPSLRGLYYTAPYLHDGSAPTLGDVLDRTATTMGHSADLTPEQRAALIAYLLTL